MTTRNSPTTLLIIVFTKPGYTIFKKQSFQFLGVDTAFVGTTYIEQLPTFPILDVSYVTFLDNIELSITIPDTAVTDRTRRAWYFVSKESNVGETSQNYSFESPVYFLFNSPSTSITIEKEMFIENDFESGNKAYIKVYPACNGFAPVGYTDVRTGLLVFTNLGLLSSDVIEVIVPQLTSYSY